MLLNGTIMGQFSDTSNMEPIPAWQNKLQAKTLQLIQYILECP